ncbi:MAG: hypothetical protein KatS3mg027_2706 [Bacteroidia bacterium]|nr:MAG: hypothetical protein KatS3mg027_2706 [Bacteroidia bacterium]
MRVTYTDKKSWSNGKFALNVSSSQDYYPFGSVMEGRDIENFNYRFGFNGQEKDDEVNGNGNSYDFGARIYDSRVGRWSSIDPLASKYSYESPYVFVGNSPIICIDPDGREKIVVTGGEYDSDRYKFNFVEPAIKQLKVYKVKAGTEQVTWAVMNIGYTEEQIASFKSTADELGVNFVLLNSANELTIYLNKKTTKLEGGLRGTPMSPDELVTTVSEERSNDLVTDLSVFAHGFVGSMEFGYHQEGSENFSFDADDVSNLNSDAFNNETCTIDIFTCNAATPTDSEGKNLWSSLAGQLAKQTKTKVTGYQGRTDYTEINKGEGYGDKLNRMLNGYNTRGSQNLPKGGTQSNGKPSKRWSFDKTTKTP